LAFRPAAAAEAGAQKGHQRGRTSRSSNASARFDCVSHTRHVVVYSCCPRKSASTKLNSAGGATSEFRERSSVRRGASFEPRTSTRTRRVTARGGRAALVAGGDAALDVSHKQLAKLLRVLLLREGFSRQLEPIEPLSSAIRGAADSRREEPWPRCSKTPAAASSSARSRRSSPSR
jgi:hypothetical protein